MQLEVLTVKRIRSTIGENGPDDQLRVLYGKTPKPKAGSRRQAVHRVLLIPVDVDDDCFDLEKPVVTWNAKLEECLVAFMDRGAGLYVDSGYREVDEERRMLFSADGQRAATNEGDSERSRCLRGLSLQHRAPDRGVTRAASRWSKESAFGFGAHGRRGLGQKNLSPRVFACQPNEKVGVEVVGFRRVLPSRR